MKQDLVSSRLNGFQSVGFQSFINGFKFLATSGEVSSRTFNSALPNLTLSLRFASLRKVWMPDSKWIVALKNNLKQLKFALIKISAYIWSASLINLKCDIKQIGEIRTGKYIIFPRWGSTQGLKVP